MKKALIINDSRLERMVLQDQLTRLGYEVDVADEYNWLGKLTKDNFDVAIVNYTMCEITGDKIISTINSNYPSVKCYLSSSNNLASEDFNEVELAGIIKTPVTLESLDNTLNDSFAFCPYCGKSLNQNFSYCPYCGSKLIL
ncbi:MAG: response regulator [Syntrophomonadaceae bacterium]|nr:response regulator [Syntrophomonadaceae bacterium]